MAPKTTALNALGISENNWFETSWSEGPFRLDEVSRMVEKSINPRAADGFCTTSSPDNRRVTYRDYIDEVAEATKNKDKNTKISFMSAVF